MTNQNNFADRSIDKSALTKYMVFGAIVGLAVISMFVFGADNPKPEWGEYWRIRPLVITPLSGAAGGAVLYFMNNFWAQRGIGRIVTLAASVLIAIIGLWMGIVLGLDGTLWD